MSKQIPLSFPKTHYFRCVNADDMPDKYVGDWPEQGKVYSGHVKPSFHSGEPHLFLDGFWAEKPWGSFAFERFEHVFSIHLN